MASNPKLTFEISATDKSSATLAKIKAAVASLGGEVSRAASTEGKLGSGQGVDRLGKGFDSLGKSVSATVQSLTAIVPAMGAVTGAASIAGLAALTYKWSEFGQALGKQAARIGVTASQLQGFQGAAQLAGASSEAAASGMQTLKDAITDTIGGRNAEALVFFRTLQVNLQKADGSARGVSEVLPEVIDGLKKISDPSLRARAGVALLGGAYEELAPLIAKGSAGLAEYTAQARKHGLLNDKGVLAATEMAFAQRNLTQAFEGTGWAVAEKLAPVLTPLLTQMANWVDAHRTDIADAIGGIAKQFKDWVDGGGLKQVTTDIKDMATKIDDVVKSFGGWKFAAEALGAVLVLKLLSPVTSLVTQLTALAAFRIGPAIAGALGLGVSTAVGLPLLTSGDTFDPNKNRKPFLGEGAYDNPYLDPRNPNKVKPVGQAIRDWWSNMAMPRGIRNNNPLNLGYVPGQGAAGSDGRFGQYATMEQGIAAEHRQLMRYQDEGNDSLIKIIRKWAPPSENDTAGYIHAVSESTGYDPDQKLNMRDPVVAARVMRAMAEREVGRRNVPDAATFAAGVGLNNGNAPSMNAPAISAPFATGGGAGGTRGSVEVLVKLQGAPAGSTASVSSSGDVKPRALIERPQFAGG